MNRKIMFLDLDGTLLNSKKEVTQRTKEAIEQAMGKGHVICLCSGRPYASMVKLVDALGLGKEGSYTICFNGGMIFENVSKKAIYEKGLDKKDFDYIWDIASKEGMKSQSYSQDKVLVEEMSGDALIYGKRIKMDVAVVADIKKEESLTPFKIVLVDYECPQNLHQFRKKYENDLPATMYGMFTEVSLLEYVPMGVSKGEAIRILCEYLQIPLEDTYGIGDAENDKTMLETCGRGLAMANSISLICEIADEVLPFTNDEDGVAWAIEKYLL